METVSADYAQKKNKAVAIWLLAGVGMVVIQILLGGITRLTGSGLSITEWNIVTGALPPLHEQQWVAAFAKYKQTPQYQLVNNDFTLHDFKFIFFWEWIHRLWARLLGVVFAIGFIYFLATRKFKEEMIIPLVILFLLGAMQGLVGWIMVLSGFVGDAVYVKPTRLALHFVLALGLLSYTFWFALQLLVPKNQVISNRPLRRLNIAILLLLVLQLLYGALMAGHKAATAAPTWPDINGQLIPMGLYNSQEGFINFINNKILVHFMHRGIAYLLLVLVTIWSVRAIKLQGSALFRKTLWLPAALVLLQVVLGILAVLSSPGIVANKWRTFEWMAQLHQFTGMLFLLTMIWTLFINRNIKQAAAG